MLNVIKPPICVYSYHYLFVCLDMVCVNVNVCLCAMCVRRQSSDTEREWPPQDRTDQRVNHPVDTHNPPRAEGLRWKPAAAIGDSTLSKMAEAWPSQDLLTHHSHQRNHWPPEGEREPLWQQRCNMLLDKWGGGRSRKPTHTHIPTHTYPHTRAHEERRKLQQPYILVKCGTLCTFQKNLSHYWTGFVVEMCHCSPVDP